MSLTDEIPSSVEHTERVFSKTYNECTPVYVPTIGRAYLAIRNEWFTKYVVHELWKIYDCYITEFSEEYSKRGRLCAPGVEAYAGSRYESYADATPPQPPVNSRVTGGDSDIEPAT